MTQSGRDADIECLPHADEAIDSENEEVSKTIASGIDKRFDF